MLYSLTSKKASEIAYYISLYVHHFGAPRIFHCDNSWEFKGALLIFLKKHGIKLINGRPQTPRTQRLVEKANAVVKNKITWWQAEHGIGTWAESLTKIREAINRQTHDFLPARVMRFQLMFPRNLLLRNTKKTIISQDQRAFLTQISINNIDRICFDEPLQKGATISEELKTTIEVALDMVPNEEVNHESNSDPESPLKFWQVFSFFIKYMTDTTDIIILLFRNKSKQKAHETRSVSSSSSSTSSISSLPKARHRSRQPTLPFSTKSDHRRATPRSKSPYFNIQSNLSDRNVSPPNVSVPEYLSPLGPGIMCKIVNDTCIIQN